MKKLQNIHIWTFVILAALAFFMIFTVPGTALSNPIPILGLQTSPRNVPNAEGFIQRWLILEPVSCSQDTQNGVQKAVKTEQFLNELTKVPSDGAKMTVGDRELTWHAVDTNEYNVNLYYFAAAVGTTCNNALFWTVVVVNCPEEIKDARLSIGSNSASVWWVNGKEVVGIYGDRQCIVDDGISKRLTLKKGPNVIRAAIVNRSGAADFCARLIDIEGKPLTKYTVSLREDGK